MDAANASWFARKLRYRQRPGGAPRTGQARSGNIWGQTSGRGWFSGGGEVAATGTTGLALRGTAGCARGARGVLL